MDDTSQKIEATLLKTAVQVTLKSKNGQVVIQQQVEGWTDDFRTASEQQIHQTIENEKFQVLANDVKQEIKMAV